MEYEYIETNTPDNMKKALEWVLSDGAEVQSKFHGTWSCTQNVLAEHTYRRKKSEFLTDVEEISKGIKEGKVLYCSSGGNTSNPKHWRVAEIELTNIIEGSLARGGKYKYAEEVFLTDVEEISKGIKEGKVLYCPSGRDATNPKNWSKAECTNTGRIAYFLATGVKFRYATEELFLTNAEVISKGIKAKKVLTTLETENGTLWTLANESNKYLIQQRLRQGSKYKLKPGETLPPKESEFLTDVEEISRGIKEGKVLYCPSIFNTSDPKHWHVAEDSNTESIAYCLDVGGKYKYAKDAFLTDAEEISKGVKEGRVLFSTADIDKAKSHNWRLVINSDTKSIQHSLLHKVKYKYAEEDMTELTDPIQIMHCILSGTAMLQRSKEWTKPMSADINDVFRNMHDGMKYWVKK